ncbi:hypothetical protein RFM98_31040, partial [Mesorhizobium sp. VK9D]|nr:hypothetical protein [Mesorhizobium sp. VK9D]
MFAPQDASQHILPLMELVGEAVLAYLRSGRPMTDAREIFQRTRAPYRKLDKLYSVVRRRLRDAARPCSSCSTSDPGQSAHADRLAGRFASGGMSSSLPRSGPRIRSADVA